MAGGGRDLAVGGSVTPSRPPTVNLVTVYRREIDLANGRTRVRQLREAHPGVVVLAHPECPPEVVAEADFAGSTAAMSDYVATKRPGRVVLVTECSMSDNVAVQFPEIDFVRPCNLCPHMKRITLPKIRHALETMTEAVELDPAVIGRARAAVERMLEVR